MPDTEPNPALSPPVEPPCAKDVVTVGAVTYIGVGCRYVPLPGRCVDLLPAAGAAPPAGTDPLASAAACAGGTIGGPDPDPNAPACSEALPNPYPDSDRTTAQVGCRDWVVPVSCTSLLEALEALPPASIDAAQAAQALADCITTWYDRNEENCVVNQSLGVERTEVVAFFFITWGKSKGFLVEEFGDGRVRVHLLTGSQIGAQVSTPRVVPSFAATGFLTGYETDDTYEFPDKATAQDWINWNKEREAAYVPAYYSGEAGTGEDAYYQQIRDEPPRRKQSTSRTNTQNVSATVDVSRGGGPEATVGVSNSVEVEDRLITDPAGWRVQSYQATNGLAAAMLLQLGGKAGDFGIDLKAVLAGESIKGSLSVTAIRRADGSLDRLVITADDTLMRTLKGIGVDISVALRAGFAAGGGWSRLEEEGTSHVVQVVLPVEALTPEQATRVDALTDAIFPRNPDGSLKKGDVSVDHGFDELGQIVRASGTTRTVDYGVERTTDTTAGGLDFAGLPLVEVTDISTTEKANLTDSTLEVTDVNGDSRDMSPAPKCAAPAVDPATYPYDSGTLAWDPFDGELKPRSAFI